MKANMGNNDRIIRTIIALAVFVLYLTGTVNGVLGLVLVLFAVVFLLTSLVSFCPLYVPLGISTCKKEKKPV